MAARALARQDPVQVGADRGAEGIDWLLLTTWPVTTLKMARRVVRWYALRWGIECWHKVLKVVCGVERRQMKSAQALERALALDMIIADRVLLLTRLGKEHPELPAELFYTPDELEVLAVKKRKPATLRLPNSPCSKPISSPRCWRVFGGEPATAIPGPSA